MRCPRPPQKGPTSKGRDGMEGRGGGLLLRGAEERGGDGKGGKESPQSPGEWSEH